MNRSDFIDWQSQPITKAFYSAINERIELLKEELAQVSDDPKWDHVKRGAIQALRDIMDADWFEETEV
jgi:hypothetical protein